MFAVSSANAGKRFGAQEEEAMVPYFRTESFMTNIVEELESIEKSGSGSSQQNVYCEMVYNDDTLKKYGVAKMILRSLRL